MQQERVSIGVRRFVSHGMQRVGTGYPPYGYGCISTLSRKSRNRTLRRCRSGGNAVYTHFRAFTKGARGLSAFPVSSDSITMSGMWLNAMAILAL